MKVTDIQTETTHVKTQILNRLLEISEAMLLGNYAGRVVTDFDNETITKIADNFNQLADKLQLNKIEDDSPDPTVNSFIEVISSFANLDFKQKLPITERGTVMDAIATGINILGDELEQSTASKLELEMERNRLNEAQAIAKIGSWELDTAGFHLTASKEAYRIFGLEDLPEDLLYNAYRSKIHPEDVHILDDLTNGAIKNGEAFATGYRILCEDLKIKYIHCIGEAIKNKETASVLLKGTIQDITEIKRVEQALKKAKEAAEEANFAKSQFLANMSHEIRTPLNGILGLTQVMLGEDIKENHRMYLETISSSGKNLSQLINDILDFSKIESGKLRLENIPFNFREAISSTIKPYKILAEQKQLELSYQFDESIPDELVGDPTRISQLLINLIGNSIKFTDQGRIEIVFSLLEMSEEGAEIQGIVKDTGIGIPKEKLNTIFSSFTQVDDSVARKYGGTGLGLSIVKNLLLQMRGDIRVSSPADRMTNSGSEFTFSIKLKLSKEQTTSDSKGNELKKLVFEKSLSILIVDDHPVNLLVAELIVKKFGAKVTTARSGGEAISLVKNSEGDEYDLVLMDIQMPGLDGYQTTKELRRLKYRKPIIALSANAFDDDVRSSLSSGMNDHLQKPYTKEKLFQKIIEHVA